MSPSVALELEEVRVAVERMDRLEEAQVRAALHITEETRAW